MGIRRWTTPWLNAGLDPATTQPLTLRRARAVALGSGAMNVFAAPFVYLYLHLGLTWMAGMLATAVVLNLVNLHALRRSHRVQLSGHITLTMMGILIISVLAFSGGFSDLNFGALHLLPLAAFAWLGARHGWAWAAITAAIVLAFWWLDGGQATSTAGIVGDPDFALGTTIRRLGSLLGVSILAAAFLATHEHQEKALVEERTQLQSAVKESRDAEQALEREAAAQASYVATVSHELRTPMNAALGSAALLMDTELSAEQRRLVRTIHHSGQALLDVVDDILDFSKIQAGALSLEHTPFSLRDALEAVGEMLAPLAHARGLELVCDLAPDLPERSLGDASRLRQVVLNLMSNALKFTTRGEIVLRAARNQPGRIEISVQDSGVGMSAAQTARVFDPFVQAEPSTAGEYGGTGLGLTISRKLAQLMGGDVQVTSAAGQGSTFRVTVALEELEPARAPSHARSTGPHVLVVDAHPAARAQLGSLLRAGKLAHACASDAVSAAQLLAARPFDVVLVDAALLEATLHAVKQRSLIHLRVVVLRSPGALGQEVPHADNLAELHKPVRRDALFRVLSGRGESTQGGRTERQIASASARVADDAPLVLVAEDNAPSAELARQMVNRHGYRCEVVHNGTQVLERLARGGVRLVLMDCQMPGMNGFDAARATRREHHTALPIVAVTAYTTEADRRRVLDAGMNDFLTKPYTLASLGEVLERWCPLPSDGHTEEAGLRDSGEIPTHYEMAFERLRGYVPAEQSREDTVELLEHFLRESEARTARLRAALDSQHTNSMQREAHALRGSLGFLGQVHACDLCTELTSLSLPRDGERAAVCLAKLHAGLSAIRLSRPRGRLASA